MYPHLVIVSAENGLQTHRFKTYGEAVAIYIELLVHTNENAYLNSVPDQEINW